MVRGDGAWCAATVRGDGAVVRGDGAVVRGDGEPRLRSSAPLLTAVHSGGSASHWSGQ